MSFLDRFKLQPRWKHADPAVRAAAVAELTDDPEHQQALVELAGSDEDVRVRRAALERLNSVEELARFARSDGDETLRRELSERLVGVAVSPNVAAEDAGRALGGLEDQRQLASVAESSPHLAVRGAALERISDSKVLSHVARQASDAQTALDAVARVTDPADLLNIALKTDQKDAGIAALERANTDAAQSGLRETLDAVATRAKNKSVAKRARSMLQAMDDAEAAQRAALEHWQLRVASVLSRVEALAAAPVAGDTGVQLAAAESDWVQLASSGTFALDADTNARFGALAAEAHAALDRHATLLAEQKAEEERLASLRASRSAICEQVEAVHAEAALEAVDKARAEWEGLRATAGTDDPDPNLHARFEAVCRRAIERHANREAIEAAHARLATVALDAERLAAAEPFDESGWKAAEDEWRSLTSRADGLDETVMQHFADASARVAQRTAERRAVEDRTLRQHVQRVEQMIERAQARAAADDVTVREADRLTRDLRAAIDSPPPLAEHDRQALVERLKAALALVAPKLHDLREMDEWKRFANAAVQEELIAQTEALRTKYHLDAEGGPSPDDIEKASRDLHDIQERWKQVAEAPRAQAQALWHRYRQAADPIQTRAHEFFAQRAEERKVNLERKLALIERAEALAESTDWIKTADELKKLQHEWQQSGPVPRNDTRATWKRFREACDKFFTRRNADLAERKETWSANLAKKEALCARAEELATSREWDRGASEIRRLQADWKTIGPVRRNKSEAIWQRFRAACDTFFDRYKRRDEIEIESRQADREALIAELEALIQPSASEGQDAAPAETPSDLLERVRSLRTRWNQTSSVVRHGADPLSVRFVDALERVMTSHPDQFRGTELDVEASRQKMEKLVAKVEGFLAEAPPPPANSSQALADMLREALASNTIGGRGSDEARWRAIAEDVRQAQASWTRLGPVPGQAGRDLTERFHRACNRVFEQLRRRVPQQSSGGGGRRKELQTR